MKQIILILFSACIFIGLIACNPKQELQTDELQADIATLKLQEIHNFFVWNYESKDSLKKALSLLDEVEGESNFKKYIFAVVNIHLENYEAALQIVSNPDFIKNNESFTTYMIVGALTEIERDFDQAANYYELGLNILRKDSANDEIFLFKESLVEWLINNDSRMLDEIFSTYSNTDNFEIEAYLNLFTESSRETFLSNYIKTVS